MKLLPARKEEENAWSNFDINVSPSHFNLTSAVEVEDKYKTKVEQKLRECYEKKIVKHNYQQIFFATKQYRACKKLMVNLLLVLTRLPS